MLTKAYGMCHYNAARPCGVCPASAAEDAHVMMRSNCFLPYAQRQTLMHMPDAWRRSQDTFHCIFELSYLSILNIEPDELHIMHLGTTQYMLGSTLWSLCYQLLPGTPSQNMEQVWGSIVSYYSEHQVDTQYSNLTRSSFCDTRRPPQGFSQAQGKGC